MVPVLKDTEKKIKDHVYHAFPLGGYLGRAIRTERYRMVEWKKWNDPNDVVYELYDFKTDPLETKNIASEQPEVLAEMKQILARHPEAKRPARR